MTNCYTFSENFLKIFQKSLKFHPLLPLAKMHLTPFPAIIYAIAQPVPLLLLGHSYYFFTNLMLFSIPQFGLFDSPPMVYRTKKATKGGFLLTERPFFYKMGVLGKYVNLLFYGFRPSG
jgi:hypothetical protein